MNIKHLPFRFLTTVLLLLIFNCSYSQSVVEIEVLERYSNSLQNKAPKGDIYLVVGFSDDFLPYFFDKSNDCYLSIVKNGTETKKINKSAFFKNPSSGVWEYYQFISTSFKLSQAQLFDLYLISTDSVNYTKVSFTEKDKLKLIKTYQPPAPNASAKEKLEYYKRTGDRQGELLGQAKIIDIHKRVSCSVKKARFRKEGINGSKEMIYGF